MTMMQLPTGQAQLMTSTDDLVALIGQLTIANHLYSRHAQAQQQQIVKLTETNNLLTARAEEAERQIQAGAEPDQQE